MRKGEVSRFSVDVVFLWFRKEEDGLAGGYGCVILEKGSKRVVGGRERIFYSIFVSWKKV